MEKVPVPCCSLHRFLQLHLQLHYLRSDVARSIICNMNTAAKLLQAMHGNPLDWQLAQLQTVARQNGIDWRHAGTSHCVFVRPDGKTLPVPARRPVKPIYVKKFLELVEGA
ncbi:MAG: hypothetical protein Q8O52_10700 [Sulfuritalea sp.]|nr:hypothetical protein [Sulfuritalea sp.]